MKCPRCGSRRTASILYGLPAFEEDDVRLDASPWDGQDILGLA